MRPRSLLIALLLSLALLPGTALAQTFLTGTFSAAQETHDVTSEATGTAALAVTDEGVRFLITVEGLSGPISAAHFHNAPAGTDGPVVRTITGDFSGNTASGLWTSADTEPLTGELLRELLAGNLYLNVHTANNPAGEIRAQLHPTSGAGLSARLTTVQETHDVSSEATGTATVLATKAGVLFFATVDGLSGPISAAHFHNAPAGTDGPVVRTITGDFSGNTAFGLWTSTDTEPLTGELLRELLAGNLYLNVHTANNPAGEIRGQVLLNSGWGFNATLDPEQETHDVTSEATGTATLTLTSEGLAFNLTVEGLSGPISAAHFHNAPAGTDGPVVRTITGDFSGNTASGLWTSTDTEPLTGELLRELLAGNLYLNVHTANNPAGEIRGQVLPSGGTPLSARLTTAQETHDVTGEATGTAALAVTDEGVRFLITVEGLSGPISAAHFHNAPAGTDGPVVRTITGDFSGNTASGLWTSTDTEPLTGELLRELLAGNLYLNVHTANNPAGEIRGQILPSGGTPLSARLTTAQETHDVSGEATGTATLTLTSEGLAFNLTVEGLSGPISAAHFHNAPAGENGSVVRTITGDFSGNTASGLWTSTDTEPLTGELLRELLAGNLYLNVHTANNPAGEIRGQILLSGGIGAATSLDPEQETHDVMSEAAGTAALTLADAGLVYRMTVDGLSGPISAAHFHNAPAGTDGPVVRTITGDFSGNTASGLWTSADTEPLTGELLRELLAGNLYLNVHTANNPAGEIRGQVLPDGVVVTAVERVDDVPPVTYRLEPNYPNPFKGTTTITFALPRTTRARLDIFNVLGKRVATPVDGPLTPGTYAVTFDASRLPSGVYLYRLTADGITRTHRMTVIR
ncbi:MAG: hypothetical protein KatS3mg043_0430 [Rhodothermaceae bacterium]|nr:MAG: hypothetical protein KatS3mg043_0430 [Rhodothermaceae bacterium]